MNTSFTNNRTPRANTSDKADETRFNEMMLSPLNQAKQIGEADLVIGIPFYNETDSIAHVIETAKQGLNQFYPDLKSVIVAAGAPVGAKALELINEIPQDSSTHQIAFILSVDQLGGKGWGVRAISEISQTLGADQVILEADLKSRTKHGELQGLSPDWIYLLYNPIKTDKADMVISKFNHHHFEAPISTLLGYPLMTSIYNHSVHRLVGGQWATSHRFLREYLKEPDRSWNGNTGSYGIDTWVITTAITGNARICEANLGIKIHRPSAAKRDLVLRQVIEALFTQIVEDRDWWEDEAIKHEPPFIKPLATFGIRKTHQPDEAEINLEQSIVRFKQGFNKFHVLYEGILPKEIFSELERLSRVQTRQFSFSPNLWAQTIYGFLLAFAFEQKFDKGDLLDSLVFLHRGFTASFALDMQILKGKLSTLPPGESSHLLSLEAEQKIEDVAEEFVRLKPDFLAAWGMASEALKPPVPQITYREFIPGVPLVVPTELKAPDGTLVRANEIYNSIFKRQKEEFEHFVYEKLNISHNAGSSEVSMAIKNFLLSIENEILPGIDLSTLKGTQKMVDIIFENFPHKQGFSAIPQMATRFLSYYPPINLITKMGENNLDELLEKHDPLDILALTNWTEEQEYLQHLWQLIADGLRSEHFAPSEIKPIVVLHNEFPSLVEMKDSSALDKLTSRIIVSNLHKGMGGEFPKLRYLTTIGKSIVEAERFGQIWKRFATSRKDFGRKIVDSIEGHWGREPLSAHNIFEDGNQRVLLERVQQMVMNIDKAETNGDRGRVARYEHLRDLAECYHLAMALSDGKFVTCSAWSWASYSFKGGRKTPPPLSLHVERDWSSREFLIEYYKAVGGTEEEVEETIIELIEQGRESENLAPVLLGTEKGADEVIPRETIITGAEQPPAGNLIRFEGNPVLEPIKEHPWESKYVLNSGMIYLEDKFYMVYRAFGDDKISRLGLAVSNDGFKFNERLDDPIFEPDHPSEIMGCEDPRLTLIDNRIYMAYTAYDGLVAQIALASISIKDFQEHPREGWRRHGLVFPGFDDKDAAMFPEKFDGKFAMLHRVDPHMWITFSSHLRCPWPRREHKIVAGTTTGMMWDGRKIGAGAQPIKTKFGWLLITHGVDYAHVYRLGIMLFDLHDPSKLIYRSPNFVLEPEAKWELGTDDSSWVPNVVFTCGALPQINHINPLDAEDTILIYYGASDTVMAIATAKVADMIPEEFR